jgi:RNA polymerase sigma factor (sigma-70 family)
MSPWISVRFLQTQSDERLLAAAREGHKRAFEALVQRYRKSLLRYCRRLLLPEARAEDALQQGLLQAWLALQAGTEVRDARAWLYRVVHNAAIDALRSSGYDHEELSESLEGATAPHADLERRVAVRRALAGVSALPEMQREALLRTAIEGHTHEQVAAALGLSDGAVRGLVYRARATLRAAATAITPAPLVTWIAEAGRRSVPLAQRLSGAGAGGGAGGTGALLKGGAAVLTAGALVAGVAVVHRHAGPRGHRGAATTDNVGGHSHPTGTGVELSRAAKVSRAGAGTSTSAPGGSGAIGALGRVPVSRAEGSGPRLRVKHGATPVNQPSQPAGQEQSDASPASEPRAAASDAPVGASAPAASLSTPATGATGATGSEGAPNAPRSGGAAGGDDSSEPRDSPSPGGGSDDGPDPGANGTTGGTGSTSGSGSGVGSGSTGGSGPTGPTTGTSD